MERPLAVRRPWYLLVALVISWLFGISGCTEGSEIIRSYWAPSVDVETVANKVDTDEARDQLKIAGERCVNAVDRDRGRLFPLAAASLVLGAATVLFAARALAGNKGSRALLVQLVIAQALFVGVRDYGSRGVRRDCQEINLAVASSMFGKYDPKLAEPFTPQVIDLGLIAAFLAHAAVAGMVVFSLTRPRSLAWYDAMEQRRSGVS